MDERLANEDRQEDRQRVRAILTRRMQSFFITLRADFPVDANAILLRAEQQATQRGR